MRDVRVHDRAQALDRVVALGDVEQVQLLDVREARVLHRLCRRIEFGLAQRNVVGRRVLLRGAVPTHRVVVRLHGAIVLAFRLLRRVEAYASGRSALT